MAGANPQAMAPEGADDQMDGESPYVVIGNLLVQAAEAESRNALAVAVENLEEVVALTQDYVDALNELIDSPEGEGAESADEGDDE